MSLSYNQVTVATSTPATQIIAATNTSQLFTTHQSRKSVVVSNQGGHPVFLGDANVTATTGLNVPSGNFVTIVLFDQDSLYGIATGGSSVVSYLESGA